MHLLRIKEVMESIIKPSADTLRGVEDLVTDEDRRVLEDAAASVIASASLIGASSSGLEANRWASEARWQAFVRVMNNAGIDALVAARDHDVDALPQAGNVLYPHYEACDIEDNPGVAKP